MAAVDAMGSPASNVQSSDSLSGSGELATPV
jgi:hypothetical protein